MSITPIGGSPFDGSGRKITTASLRDQKLHHEPITCLTAYDYATARLVDEAGIDMSGRIFFTQIGFDFHNSSNQTCAL